MNNKTTSDGETSRRDFLKTSSTAAVASAATLSLISRGTAYGQNSDTIRVGPVGCGGRGTGAANQALSADDNVKLTAVADVFPDAVDRAVNGLKKRHEKKVDVPHQFVGLDAYQKLIDSGVDLVVLATPPGFRPVHFRAVVEAGKHCFIEKPMATDAPGVRSIMESVKISKQKNLAIVAGFCWRYDYERRAFYPDMGRPRRPHKVEVQEPGAPNPDALKVGERCPKRSYTPCAVSKSVLYTLYSV